MLSPPGQRPLRRDPPAAARVLGGSCCSVVDYPIAKALDYQFKLAELPISMHALKTALYRCFFVVIMLVGPACAGFAQAGPPTSTAAASSFVQQILSQAGSPSSVSVSFQSISVLPMDQQESVQNAIFTGFRDAGVRLVKPEMTQVQVQIAFSEDFQGYLWIATIQRGAARKLVMHRFARAEHLMSSRAPQLTLRKEVILQQSTPILDFYQDRRTLALLEPEQISIYTSDDGRWRLRYTLAITHAKPWPRDLRGRLQVNGSQLTAFLPGTRCNGNLSSPSLDCRAGDDPWQLDQGAIAAFYSPLRNFFTGILAGANAGASVIPFFAAATWQNGDQRQWLFAGIDGRARLYQNELSAPAAMFSAWGGNLAAIHSGCGSGWQVLVSAPSDSIHPDSVQAVEIAGREALPVSSSLELSGALQALWTTGKNSETVNAVMQSPETGKYEAFTLTVSCGQ
jgi:hypothetical protein